METTVAETMSTGARRRLAHRRKLAQQAQAVIADAAGGKYPKAIVAKLQQEAFERLCEPESDPELLRLLLGAYLKHRQIALAEKRFKLAREKHRVMLRSIQAKLGLAPAAKPQLSQTEMTAIMDRLDEVLGIAHAPPPPPAGLPDHAQ